MCDFEQWEETRIPGETHARDFLATEQLYDHDGLQKLYLNGACGLKSNWLKSEITYYPKFIKNPVVSIFN